MKLGKRIYLFFDRAGDLFAGLAGVILSFLALVICVDVIMRYFLNRPIENVTEATEHGLLFVTFLGTAWVQKKGAHVSVDIFYNQLSPRTKVLFNLITSILSLIVSLALTWAGCRATWNAFQRGTPFATTWALPQAPILAIIPVGSFLMLLQFLKESFGHLDKWRLQRSNRARSTKTASEG